MKRFVLCLSGIVLSLLASFTAGFGAVESNRPPNVVIIFCDDLGYADIGSFGAKGYSTPNLDRMATEGRKFTDFYVGQAVCSASRAALLTGCYPGRVGIQGALGPHSKFGISSRETTIAQMLKAHGYATGMYGKWHLGDAPQFLPTHHGFDEYFGLPYSHDMWPNHPTNGKNYPPLPLIEGDKVVQVMPDLTQLTTWYTERAVKFIEANKSHPFFLYVAHNLPHVPLFVSDKFKGKSERGLYGDVVMELDWSVGQILDALKRNGIDENTLVIFTSDNGPWLLYGDHAGSALPLREGKATSFDGGVREPCLMRWPGKIPAGTVCHDMVLSMDVLPTVAKLTGAQLPQNKIDGLDAWPLISGQKGATTQHEAFFVYWGKRLEAVRSGKWKLHIPHNYTKPNPAGHGGQPGKYSIEKIGLELFDLENDIGETTNVADQNPEVVKRLEALAEKCREDLGDSATKQQGSGVRPAEALKQD